LEIEEVEEKKEVIGIRFTEREWKDREKEIEKEEMEKD